MNPNALQLAITSVDVILGRGEKRLQLAIIN